jgi:hypothetical protein
LGTEFGVEVDKQGGTTSHVYRGVVRVQVVAADGRSEKRGRILRENESVRVDSGSERKIAVVHDFNAARFVHQFPKQSIKVFDLVDVVAGSDGFSGRRNRGIDPRNGQVVDVLVPNVPTSSLLAGDAQYHRVAGMPFVDGVFIPNGGKGVVQADSAGHVCDSLGDTANSTRQYIWAGGQAGDGISTIIDSVDYASAGHRLLFVHANNAITFDLDAIRRANVGCKLLRFCATAGNTGRDVNCYADIRVLIDGETRLQRRQINSSHGGFSVVVPIHDKHRFLTLAATDGGDGIHYDWIIFGDPRLELTPAKATADATSPQETAEHRENEEPTVNTSRTTQGTLISTNHFH